ncbi:MAG: hypothetical protein QM800_13185 [Paludibacter sp.]
MPKEDYLLKYLEKLSRVIAAMLGLREKGLPEAALRLADETYKEMLDLNTDELALMPVSAFVEIVRKAGYSSSHLDALAKLLYETACSFQQKGNRVYANSFFQKALEVFYLLNEKDKTFSFEREMLISDLKQLIEDCQ